MHVEGEHRGCTLCRGVLHASALVLKMRVVEGMHVKINIHPYIIYYQLTLVATLSLIQICSMRLNLERASCMHVHIKGARGILCAHVHQAHRRVYASRVCWHGHGHRGQGFSGRACALWE